MWGDKQKILVRYLTVQPVKKDFIADKFSATASPRQRMKHPSLKYFIVRQRVLHFYRNVIRASRRKENRGYYI
jgi:hypothetical protein